MLTICSIHTLTVYTLTIHTISHFFFVSDIQLKKPLPNSTHFFQTILYLLRTSPASRTTGRTSTARGWSPLIRPKLNTNSHLSNKADSEGKESTSLLLFKLLFSFSAYVHIYVGNSLQIWKRLVYATLAGL